MAWEPASFGQAAAKVRPEGSRKLPKGQPRGCPRVSQGLAKVAPGGWSGGGETIQPCVLIGHGPLPGAAPFDRQRVLSGGLWGAAEGPWPGLAVGFSGLMRQALLRRDARLDCWRGQVFCGAGQARMPVFLLPSCSDRISGARDWMKGAFALRGIIAQDDPSWIGWVHHVSGRQRTGFHRSWLAERSDCGPG